MTASAAYELLGDGAAALDADATALRWPQQPGATATVRSDLGWHLQPWGAVTPAAVDLVRIAAGAYLADRLTPRGASFSRHLHLTVATSDPAPWHGSVGDELTGLLHWLTGDWWELNAVDDQTPHEAAPQPTAAAVVPFPPGTADEEPTTSLLSGGLDSFLGAIHLLHTHHDVAFIGHRDAANAVRGAQDRVQQWLADSYSPVPSYTRVALRQARQIREPSSRSRSLLFTALGSAAAATPDAAQVLHIPENGYTSINLPLHPNRGGALSTRSTHPDTFRRVNLILDQLGLGVQIDNPFQALTKGEAMKLVAATQPPPGWVEAAATTVSCSKLDGGRITGGNPNYNCGLCVPCLVRRSTFIAADQPDHTRYLATLLTGTSLDELVGRRRSDIEAVRYATAVGVDDDQIDAGTWPPDHDLDATADLVRRGLDELAAVALP